MIDQYDDLQTNVVEADGKTHIERVQDCTPIAELCKRDHVEGNHGSSDMKLAARIPNVIVEKYCNDNKISFREFMGNREHMRRMLNDPSLSHFRVWPGRV